MLKRHFQNPFFQHCVPLTQKHRDRQGEGEPEQTTLCVLTARQALPSPFPAPLVLPAGQQAEDSHPHRLEVRHAAHHHVLRNRERFVSLSPLHPQEPWPKTQSLVGENTASSTPQCFKFTPPYLTPTDNLLCVSGIERKCFQKVCQQIQAFTHKGSNGTSASSWIICSY